jgi:hypothetical protein
MHHAAPCVVGQTFPNFDPAAFQRSAQAVDGSIKPADALLGWRDEKDDFHGWAEIVSR